MELRAKKSLGQHFLNSPSVLQKIIETARIAPGETILEIGPGTGVLTKALLDSGARVIAIEKDARSGALLQSRFASEIESGGLRLCAGDVLEADRGALGLAEGSYAVVANIPYYITGAILESFLEQTPRPSRMVLLVQKEVAERITAKPTGNELVGKESILSISVKAFGTPRLIERVPRGAFTPPPSVDSAILAIDDISDRRFKEKNIPISRFFKLVKAGFAHKRKYTKRNLEIVISGPELEAVWLRLGLNEKARAEDMDLEQWFSIAAAATS